MKNIVPLNFSFITIHGQCKSRIVVVPAKPGISNMSFIFVFLKEFIGCNLN